MNNAQFRRLLVDNSSSPSTTSQNAPSASSESKAPALGSRLRSSIPMTPRSVAGFTKAHAASDFAKQVSDAMAPPPPKRFKSSAAPKGTKLSEGYVDRVAMRRGAETTGPVEEDKVQRVHALEEMVEGGQMERSTFEKLRIEILGDEAKVEKKGLDWNMLRRAKRGEDVETDLEAKAELNMNGTAKKCGAEKDVDEELEGALEEGPKGTGLGDVQKKEVRKKQGNRADAGGKLARDEILKQFRKERERISDQIPTDDPDSTLGSKFRKVEATETVPKNNKKRWIEVDEKSGRRREVLMTTDKEGNPKRKVRWLDKEPITVDKNDKGHDSHAQKAGKKRPPRDTNVLGMEVPAEIAARQRAMLEGDANQEDDDDDIFAGAGADYNPLDGASEGSDSDSDSEEEGLRRNGDHATSSEQSNEPVVAPSRPRNYFLVSSKDEGTTSTENSLTQDPTLMAAIKRAAAIGKAESEQNGEITATEAEAAHRKQFLEKLKKRDREDAEDLDMGFGESRFGDDDDEEGPVWDEGEEGKAEKKTRKRGPKKKKGNKENLNDVLGVLEGRAADKKPR